MRLPFGSTALPPPGADCARRDHSARRQTSDPPARRIHGNHRQHHLPSADLPPAITPAARHQAAEIITRLAGGSFRTSRH
jgi:hypothetical protein